MVRLLELLQQIAIFDGQIIQQQYAEQADRRADNLAQSQRFWAIREGHGSVKNLLFESQTPEQRRLTEQFFEERNLDINTPLNQLSLSPKRYATAREQLTTGENIPKDGVKVPIRIRQLISRELKANETIKWKVHEQSIWETDRNESAYTFGMGRFKLL